MTSSDRPSGRACAVASAVLAIVVTPLIAYAGTPTNADGQVGLTSYQTLPFTTNIWQSSWNSTPGYAPQNLFWSHTFMNTPSQMVGARQVAQSIEQNGRIPASGAQGGSDLYVQSFPQGSIPGAPSWVDGNQSANPAMQAWVWWLSTRKDLLDVASDGGTVPSSWRSWGGIDAYISPLTPLDQADWPPGMSNATYGDWFAYRWGQSAALSGAYGIMLSDYTDSQPDTSEWHDFNARIIAAFAQHFGIQIQGSTVPQQAEYIVTNFLPWWNDFLNEGYAHYFGQLASRLGSATGRQALVIDQCGLWPAARRYDGDDARIINQTMSSNNYVCIWDDQTMLQGRDGSPMIYAIGGSVIAAAREPSIRNGANLSADDPDFWNAVAQFWGNLSSADQHERGLKELKRQWLEVSWAHIATRQGLTRRADAFVSRSYWDAGAIDPTVQNLIQSIYPAAPYGFALYYPVSVELQRESALGAQSGTSGNLYSSYFPPDEIVAFKNGGGVANYYVSDAGLANLQPSAAPAAWVVLDGASQIPAAEMAQLTHVAPVLTSLAQVLSFPNPALSFNTPALTGTGFYDQSNRLIVTATNPAAANVSGTMRLGRLSNGTYTVTDLFTNTSSQVTAVNGTASVPIAVTRWDTRAFAVTPSGG